MAEKRPNKWFLDERTMMNISKLRNAGLVSELSGPIGSGKEANIFYTEDLLGRTNAVKIHHYNINTFKQIPEYLKLRGAPSEKLVKLIDDWTRYEYEFLRKAYSIGIKCPEPRGRTGNVLVMEFIGKAGAPAEPAVHDNVNIKEWYPLIIEYIVMMGKARMIHGDLSPYNLLNLDGIPYIIDFSQALKLSQTTTNYLARDIQNINDWFRRKGYDKIQTPDEIIKRIQEKD